MAKDKAAHSLYDDVLYPGHVYEHTHPNRLGSLAALYGMTPGSPERCRVLELGCGVGGNLVPMAFQYPMSEFIGVDLSGSSIERGQKNVSTLGLSNIRLLHLDIMDVDESFGVFDYIIAHGVFSWVPASVREKMMKIFKSNLSSQGVCYVSYNAHPFSHTRDIARDMMLYHTRDISDLTRKTAQSRAIMKFLSEASKSDTVYGAIMRDQYHRVSRMPDEVLFHDDLNEIGEAFLLHEIIAQGNSHGLQYLSDAEFSRRNLAAYPPEVRETLERFPDSEFGSRDQYQDFIDGYGFRRTLFIHEGVPLNRRIGIDFVKHFLLSLTASPVSADFSLTDRSKMEFRTEDGTTIVVSDPILKAAYLYLGRTSPDCVPYPELLRSARSMLSADNALADATTNDETLSEALYILACSGEVQFRSWRMPLTTDLRVRPEVSRLARYQASTNDLVTSLQHQAVRLEDREIRAFVQLVDGTRTIPEIAEAMLRLGENADEAKVTHSLQVARKLALLVP